VHPGGLVRFPCHDRYIVSCVLHSLVTTCWFLTGITLCSPPLLSHQYLLTVLFLLIWEPCLRSECPEDVQGLWRWTSQDATTTCHSHRPSSAAPAPDTAFRSPSVQVLTYVLQFCVPQNTSLSAVRCPALRDADALCSSVPAKP